MSYTLFAGKKLVDRTQIDTGSLLNAHVLASPACMTGTTPSRDSISNDQANVADRNLSTLVQIKYASESIVDVLASMLRYVDIANYAYPPPNG